jgi:aconitate hydratase
LAIQEVGMPASVDSFAVKTTLEVAGERAQIFSLPRLAGLRGFDLDRLPFSIRVLLENLLRREDGQLVRASDVERLAAWPPADHGEGELPFLPARVLLQDFTGVPALADLAAMRQAAERLYGDPLRVNPVIPAELVIDHSVQVDHFASPEALARNEALEYRRNGERYAFLRWGQQSLRNFRVVPPATGICHQVNLEYLARVVCREAQGTETLAYPDTLVGLDSHTPMVNGIGVLGWGVGGIEAEAVLLGRPYYLLIPQVVGVKFLGRLAEGTTASDLVLTVTEMLRKKGVVGKFVEFFGPGLDHLSVEDRATIANMAPEYGATTGFFPVDGRTLDYLRLTGRSPAQCAWVEGYCKSQGLYRSGTTPDPAYSELLTLDLQTVAPCLAGPRRPQDRVPLARMPAVFREALGDRTAAEVSDGGTALRGVAHAAVVIAAITSCTNTSNPAVMLGAGLLAKNAVDRGLKVPPWVKTSLAPGSKVVTRYLEQSGLMPALEALGFHRVAYGCTTCIGNSGPLPAAVAEAVSSGDLVVAAVLSGNRNFEGRINPLTRANYLASPPLVVAFALAGRVDIDLTTEPLGSDGDGRPVYLRDIWPDSRAVAETAARAISPALYREEYAAVFSGSALWKALPVPEGGLFRWDPASSYIKQPPFFEGITRELTPPETIHTARALALLGDSVTTDHISPAGNIPADSPAGQYLQERGIQPVDFNSYGARRGNHEVMVRGTFANIRLRNRLVPGVDGGWTRLLPEGQVMTIYAAAEAYRRRGTPLVVLAGKEYGTGSSRDWAAKGTRLLGVRAVLARSFERIHRSNLVCMGVLPLEFQPGESCETLGLDGTETYAILGLEGEMTPRRPLQVEARHDGGRRIAFTVTARLDSPAEVGYHRHGGILPYVLRTLA